MVTGRWSTAGRSGELNAFGRLGKVPGCGYSFGGLRRHGAHRHDSARVL